MGAVKPETFELSFRAGVYIGDFNISYNRRYGPGTNCVLFVRTVRRRNTGI